jgi:hypothetical protein
MGDQKWIGPGGSLIFVEEDCFESIMAHLEKERIELHPSHLVISESIAYLVEEVIDKFRQIWCKKSEPFTLQSLRSSQHEDILQSNPSVSSDTKKDEEIDDAIEVELYIENTFVVIRRAVVDQETTSTTKVHCPHRPNVRLPSTQL